MTITYRLSSGIMLVSFAVWLTTAMLFPYHPPRFVIPAVSNTASDVVAISLDPCTMWDQMGQIASVSGLCWFLTLVVITVGGLRNRAVPRWVAILSVLAFALCLRYSFSLWRWRHCSSTADLVTGAIWYGSTLVMYAHQIFQRRKTA